MRHYLFSVKPGEALLSTMQTADGQRILAVSAEECELLQLPKEQFSQRIANADPEIIALIENWIDKLGAAISANSCLLPRGDATRSERQGGSIN